MNYDVSSRKKVLIREIPKVRNKIKRFPMGELLCFKNGKYVNYYVSSDNEKHYIKKENVEQIKCLAEKKYLMAQLKDYEAELRALSAYQRYFSEKKSYVNKLLSNKVYFKTISAVAGCETNAYDNWSKQPSNINLNHPEALKFPCLSGHVVRSKSEAMIDQALFSNKIPFRYEDALALDENIVYPDFTIRHPKTGEYFYWEHFGIMDSPAYVQKTLHKLANYCTNGIIPTINLITTYETKDHPLTMKMIEDVINMYFKC